MCLPRLKIGPSSPAKGRVPAISALAKDPTHRLTPRSTGFVPNSVPEDSLELLLLKRWPKTNRFGKCWSIVPENTLHIMPSMVSIIWSVLGFVWGKDQWDWHNPYIYNTFPLTLPKPSRNSIEQRRKSCFRSTHGLLFWMCYVLKSLLQTHILNNYHKNIQEPTFQIFLLA